MTRYVILLAGLVASIQADPRIKIDLNAQTKAHVARFITRLSHAVEKNPRIHSKAQIMWEQYRQLLTVQQYNQMTLNDIRVIHHLLVHELYILETEFLPASEDNDIVLSNQLKSLLHIYTDLVNNTLDFAHDIARLLVTRYEEDVSLAALGQETRKLNDEIYQLIKSHNRAWQQLLLFQKSLPEEITVDSVQTVTAGFYVVVDHAQAIMNTLAECVTVPEDIQLVQKQKTVLDMLQLYVHKVTDALTKIDNLLAE